MNLKSMIFGQPAVLFDPETYEEIILGPISGEGKSNSVSVTNLPVEKGSDISDHVSPSPKTFSVKFVMIDKNPISVQFTQDKKLVKEKITKLEDWQESGTLLTFNGPVFNSILQPGFDIVAESVVITKFDYDRSQDTGHGVSASLSLQKVKIVNTITTNIKLPQAAKKTAQKGKSETGKSSAGSSSSSSSGKKSILKSLTGGL